MKQNTDTKKVKIKKTENIETDAISLQEINLSLSEAELSENSEKFIFRYNF